MGKIQIGSIVGYNGCTFLVAEEKADHFIFVKLVGNFRTRLKVYFDTINLNPYFFVLAGLANSTEEIWEVIKPEYRSAREQTSTFNYRFTNSIDPHIKWLVANKKYMDTLVLTNGERVRFIEAIYSYNNSPMKLRVITAKGKIRSINADRVIQS